MTTQQPDWHAYLAQMETVLGVTLDDARRAELQVQFSRIASMAVTDLPDPDSPTTPTISPRSIRNDTWLRA